MTSLGKGEQELSNSMTCPYIGPIFTRKKKVIILLESSRTHLSNDNMQDEIGLEQSR